MNCFVTCFLHFHRYKQSSTFRVSIFRVKSRFRSIISFHMTLSFQRSHQEVLFAMTTMVTRIRDDIIRTGATSMSGKTRPVIDTWQSSAKGEPATCQLSSISSKLQNLDYRAQITKYNNIKPSPEHKSQNTTT